MLTVARLYEAELDSSKNSYLRELLYFVKRYNDELGSRKVSVDAKAATLAGIVFRAGAYLTSKPPQPGRVKNKRRWDALMKLAMEASREAGNLGVKLVRGQPDFRKIGHSEGHDENVNIWLEVLDSAHRHAYELSEMWTEWLNNPACIQNKTSFWDHIGTPPDGEAVEYLQEASAGKYLMEFEGGVLVDEAKNRLSTEKYRSAFAGQGWGIFVYSPSGQLFVGDHQASQFHHTSFLGGAPVLAAGEIAVDDGKVVALTSKTGHYWTTPELMRQFLMAMPQIPDKAVVRPDVKDRKQPGDYARFHWCGDYRRSGASAPTLNQIELLAAPLRPRWLGRDIFAEAPEGRAGYSNMPMKSGAGGAQ